MDTLNSNDEMAFVNLLRCYKILRCGCGEQFVPSGGNRLVCLACKAQVQLGPIYSAKMLDDIVKRVESLLGCPFPDYLNKDPLGWINVAIIHGDNIFISLVDGMKKEMEIRRLVKEEGVEFEDALERVMGKPIEQDIDGPNLGRVGGENVNKQ